MSRPKQRLGITGDFADKVYWQQLHVFQFCNFCFCFVPCFAIVFLLLYLKPYLQHRFRGSEMISLGVLTVVAWVLLFAGLAYLASMLAAVGNVLLVRLLLPALRMPEAREILLQLYSDPAGPLSESWLQEAAVAGSLLWGGHGK